MKKQLVSFLKDVRKNERVYYYDETQTKQAMVLRILNLIGWDTFDAEEVFHDYPVSQGEVDFSLRLNRENKIFIIVKRPGEELQQFESALLLFCREADVPIGVLTNGIEWWLYLPLRETEENRYKFHNIHLKMQEPGENAKKFIDYISRSRIKKKKAVKNAEKVFRSRKKKRIIREALEQIWDKYISGMEDTLFRTLARESEKIAGYPPEPSDVEAFLKSITRTRRGRGKKSTTNEKKKEGTEKTKSTARKRSTRRRNSYIGKKPKSFTFLGQPQKVKKWKEILTSVCNILSTSRGEEFEKVLDLKGRKRLYFSRDPEDLKEPRKVTGTDIYVETNFNASNLYSIALKVLKLFGYSEEDIHIETRKPGS